MKYCLSCGLYSSCDKRATFDHYSYEDCWVEGGNPPAMNISGFICNDEAVCPYCGEVDMEAWRATPDTGTHTCPSCDKLFHYRRIVEITYETKKV